MTDLSYENTIKKDFEEKQKKVLIKKEALELKKQRQEFKEGKREDIHHILTNETIEYSILEENYKPSEKDIREMATEIKSLKHQIDIFDTLCDELEEDLKQAIKRIEEKIIEHRNIAQHKHPQGKIPNNIP